MEQQLSQIELEPGRFVDIALAGDPTGRPVVYHHGTPTCRLIPADFAAAAAHRGLRFIGYSRPGYGASTPVPGRTVADDADLLAMLLDALGLGEFVSLGWSGGGPHALGAAALLPGRCRGAAVIAGVGPYGVPGLDFLAGMGQDNLDEFGAALEGSGPLRAYLEQAGAGLRAISADDIIEALASLLPDSDRAVLTGDTAEEMAGAFREAVSVGIEGWHDDDLAFTRPWGFNLAAMTTPVALWQGSEDLMVPHAHGLWLAAHTSGAVLHEVPGEGHLSVAHGRVGQMLDELLAMAGWA